jgi:hypothetical protein
MVIGPIRRLIRKALKRLTPGGGSQLQGGVRLERVHDISGSYMLTPAVHAQLIATLAAEARAFFQDRIGGAMGTGLDYEAEVARFWQLFRSRPFGENMGGSGFHNAFWIYLSCRTLNPSLVVESGVWKGHTSWLLRQTCPRAEIHGFDINLSRLDYQGGVKFHLMDWSAFPLTHVDPDRALVFFDCHINHARRIIEAHERGIRHLLFDDNPPIHLLHAFGLPGFPTANMIYNEQDQLAQDVSWYWQGQKRSYSADLDEMAKARSLIEVHEEFPNVGGITRYGGFAFLTYVRLKA